MQVDVVTTTAFDLALARAWASKIEACVGREECAGREGHLKARPVGGRARGTTRSTHRTKSSVALFSLPLPAIRLPYPLRHGLGVWRCGGLGRRRVTGGALALVFSLPLSGRSPTLPSAAWAWRSIGVGAWEYTSRGRSGRATHMRYTFPPTTSRWVCACACPGGPGRALAAWDHLAVWRLG